MNGIVVISDNNRDIGFYSFAINKENELELDYFFLHPDYIGKGFGRKMWSECIKTAKDYKKSYFIVWADPNAEGFYEKMNCKRIGVRQYSYST